MKWNVILEERVRDDLLWFGKKIGRTLHDELIARLEADPLLESKNMKTLRPNKIASRELRLLGKYRVLFNLNQKERTASVVLVGEKSGSKLLVQGEEFKDHHEGDLTD